MEIKKNVSAYVGLSVSQRELIWNSLIDKFIKIKKRENPRYPLKKLEDFDSTHLTELRKDLNTKTAFQISQIHLKAKNSKDEVLNKAQNSKDEVLNKDEEIKEEYLRNHFIYKNQTKFKKDILNRLVYYIEQSRKYTYLEYFEKNGLPIVYNNENIEIPLAVKSLEGWWIGLNRNLEKGSIAICHYIFKEVDERMFVRREAYSVETQYNGYVHVQDESKFVFDLIGQTLNRKKIIMAHTGKIKPQSIRCISTGFEVGSGNPIFIKEVLFKINDKKDEDFGTGKTFLESNLEKVLSRYFSDDLKNVIDEINEFLPIDKVPYLSPNDFNLLKSEQLSELKMSLLEPNIIKKLSILFRFEKLGGTPYEREIIKYHKNKGSKSEVAKVEKILVSDQYTKIRITRYLVSANRRHKVFYETDSASSAVDVQSLFPILDNDSDNDLKHPMLRISHRIMDTDSDNFISSATIFNEFLSTKKLAVYFDGKTMSSEIVIDFSSVPEGVSKYLAIDEITYHYNIPGEENYKELSYKVENPELKGFTFLEFDEKNGPLKVTQKASIDPSNPRIFNLNINFETDIGDILYIHFKI